MNLTIVTTEFPPSRIANARRPWLLAREMRAAGHRVRVIARRFAGPDPAATEEGDRATGLEVIRLPDPVPAWQRRWEGVRAMRALVRRLWPDEFLPWVRNAARWFRTHGDGGPVLACINPPSLLFLDRLAPALRGAVVYDYLESVTPFRREVPHHFALHRALQGRVEAAERAALGRARRAVFTSSVNRGAYASAGLIGTDRSVYLPHFCDPNPHAEGDLPCEGEMVVTYVGYFNRDRSPATFLRGLRRFLDREPGAASRLRVHCHGNGLGLHGHLAAELGVRDVVLDRGELEYGAILPAIARSHVLLLVAAPRHRLFYPSKAAEYVAARRPILSLVAPGSEIAGILREAGRDGWLCRDDDEEAVGRALAQAWEEFRSGRLGRRLPECPSVLTAHFVPQWRAVLES